jgi:hypothetical protein
MGRVNPGPLPVGVRQTSVGAMTGVAPVGPQPAPLPGNVPYTPDAYAEDRYDYVNPDDHSLATLADGGFFEFEESVKIPEIRPHVAGGTFEVLIEDRDGSHDTEVIAAASAADGDRYAFNPPVILLKAQRLVVKTSAAGSVDVYVRKGDSL